MIRQAITTFARAQSIDINVSSVAMVNCLLFLDKITPLIPSYSEITFDADEIILKWMKPDVCSFISFFGDGSIVVFIDNHGNVFKMDETYDPNDNYQLTDICISLSLAVGINSEPLPISRPSIREANPTGLRDIFKIG